VENTFWSSTLGHWCLSRVQDTVLLEGLRTSTELLVIPGPASGLFMVHITTHVLIFLLSLISSATPFPDAVVLRLLIAFWKKINPLQINLGVLDRELSNQKYTFNKTEHGHNHSKFTQKKMKRG